MYPGGEFPNPRAGEELATWVKPNRSLEESDVGLRYVFGVTHIPRLKDWPVLLADRIGFMLMPQFFNRSPAVDIPPTVLDVELKDNGGVSAKAVQNGVLAKL